jgi:RhtB (resistance to homoserine/threonine) family protein
MLGIHDYVLFVCTAVLLNLTPGPDTMYILGRSLAQGRKAGVASALGIGAGCFVHTVLAALGLSAILMASALAFTVIKFAGAAYLIFLGFKMLLSNSQLENVATSKSPMSDWISFRQGLITNVLNPKVALFFLALLPQFVEKNAAQPALGFIVLGLTFITTGTLWGLVLAFFASLIKSQLQNSQALTNAIHKSTGLVFVALGLKLAVSERGTTHF